MTLADGSGGGRRHGGRLPAVRVAALVIVLSAGLAGCGSPAAMQAPAAPAETPVAPMPETTVTSPPPPEDAQATEAPAPVQVAAAQVAEDPVPTGSRPSARSTPGGRRPQATGRIEIPAIGLSHETFEGVELAIINYGPSHWPGTAKPGERGNTVFPGHRTTYTRPFWDIDKLKAGDHVIFTTAAGRFTYRVNDTFVVNEDANWITRPTEDATFTIFACHPKGSARQRYVVKGNLVGATTTTTTARATTTTTAPSDDGLLTGILG